MCAHSYACCADPFESNGAAARRPRATELSTFPIGQKSKPGPVTQNWKHFTRRLGRRHVSRIRSNKLRGIGNRRPAQNPIRGLLLPRSTGDFLPMSTCARRAAAVRDFAPINLKTPPFYGNKSCWAKFARGNTRAVRRVMRYAPLVEKLEHRIIEIRRFFKIFLFETISLLKNYIRVIAAVERRYIWRTSMGEE